jgi:hypothetical protein
MRRLAMPTGTAKRRGVNKVGPFHGFLHRRLNTRRLDPTRAAISRKARADDQGSPQFHPLPANPAASFFTAEDAATAPLLA